MSLPKELRYRILARQNSVNARWGWTIILSVRGQEVEPCLVSEPLFPFSTEEEAEASARAWLEAVNSGTLVEV